MKEIENKKLDDIESISNNMLELKIQQAKLEKERIVQLKNKCAQVKQLRIDDYRKRKTDLDEKERELSRKTTQLVAELAATCEDTPFHKALLKILSNLKGIFLFMIFNVARLILKL